MCDHLLQATTYLKHQILPSQNPVIRIFGKRLPLISERDKFLTWQFYSFWIVFYNVVSLIDVCTTPLEVYEERSVKTWN